MKYLMVILFFQLIFIGIEVKRFERYLSDFRWALRETYPKSYFKQIALIRFVRKLFKADIKISLHWMTVLYHCYQLLALIVLIITFLASLFMPAEYFDAADFYAIKNLKFALLPFGVICIAEYIFLLVQYNKCKKIRKTNPKYSKCKLQYEKWPS